MNKEFREKIDRLGYVLSEEDEDEFDNSRTWTFTKTVGDYIIDLHCNYPIDKEKEDEFILLKIFEGQVGNDPPLVENGKIIDYDIGQECIIADSTEKDFIKNIDKWDREAEELIAQFVELTKGMPTNSFRMQGVSSGFFDGVSSEQGKSKQAKSEKVGRNDPCPCGSGQKYKKCCGG